MPHPHKKRRIMEFFTIYNTIPGSYFVNKSQRPAVSARHQFHRAFKPEREDYNCDFYQDIRKYGEDAFIVRYSVEMPEWAECRAHYVKKEQVDEALAKIIDEMRKEPTVL